MVDAVKTAAVAGIDFASFIGGEHLLASRRRSGLERARQINWRGSDSQNLTRLGAARRAPEYPVTSPNRRRASQSVRAAAIS